MTHLPPHAATLRTQTQVQHIHRMTAHHTGIHYCKSYYQNTSSEQHQNTGNECTKSLQWQSILE